MVRRDYASNTLTVPGPVLPGGHAEATQVLLYYNNVEDGNGGPTMLVDGETMGGEDELKWNRSAKTMRLIRGAETYDTPTVGPSGLPLVEGGELYARERPVRYRRGSAIFYRYEVSLPCLLASLPSLLSRAL